jgi:hypothetical protein
VRRANAESLKLMVCAPRRSACLSTFIFTENGTRIFDDWLVHHNDTTEMSKKLRIENRSTRLTQAHSEAQAFRSPLLKSESPSSGTGSLALHTVVVVWASRPGGSFEESRGHCHAQSAASQINESLPPPRPTRHTVTARLCTRLDVWRATSCATARRRSGITSTRSETRTA